MSKYIGDIDFSNVHFCAPLEEKRRKRVPMYWDNTSTAYVNRIAVQLCKDESNALKAKYHLDEVQDDGDPTRRSFCVLLDNMEDVKKLQSFDERIIQEAVKESKTWWKKTIPEEQIRFMYHKMVQYDEEKNEYTFRFKVKVNHPNPEPGKTYSRPTPIYLKSSGDKAPRGDLHHLRAGCMVTPKVSTSGVWFMGDSKFGLAWVADVMMVEPMEYQKPIDELQLTKKYEEDDTAPSASTDGEPPLKKTKTDDDGFSVELEGDSAM